MIFNENKTYDYVEFNDYDTDESYEHRVSMKSDSYPKHNTSAESLAREFIRYTSKLRSNVSIRSRVSGVKSKSVILDVDPPSPSIHRFLESFYRKNVHPDIVMTSYNSQSSSKFHDTVEIKVYN